MKDLSCAHIDGFENIKSTHQDLLADESRMEASDITRAYFPSTTKELEVAVSECVKDNVNFVTSAARTGISGGAVPINAMRVISLEGLKSLPKVKYDPTTKTCSVTLPAGYTLAELNEFLSSQNWDELTGGHGEFIYPVDPTEKSASVGGTIATDASGASSYKYGSTRDWVRALTVITPTGKSLRIARGEFVADNWTLRLPSEFGITEIELPRIEAPKCKSVAGYALSADMDLVDLIIGSEGTLGVVAEAELKLAPRPDNTIWLLAFLDNSHTGIELVKQLRASELTPSIIELFANSAIKLLRSEFEEGADNLPEIPLPYNEAVFLALEYSTESEFEEQIELLSELLDTFGSSLDDTWVGDDAKSCERIRILRHAVPEAINSRIGRLKRNTPELHKVGTDFAVPDTGLDAMMATYMDVASNSNLETVLFGHAGENHLHLNFIPKNELELKLAIELHAELAERIVALGGSVTAEHGIGRIKKNLLVIQFGSENVEKLKALKLKLDPQHLFNRGVMF